VLQLQSQAMVDMEDMEDMATMEDMVMVDMVDMVIIMEKGLLSLLLLPLL